MIVSLCLGVTLGDLFQDFVSKGLPFSEVVSYKRVGRCVCGGGGGSCSGYGEGIICSRLLAI